MIHDAMRRLRRGFRIRRRQLANIFQVIGLHRLEGPARREAAIRPRRPSPDPATPVILCVWRRLRRLGETIALLERQDAHVELYVWNNARRARPQVDSIIAGATHFPIRVIHSSRNVGGFGRFYMARTLAPRHPFAIFIDDDLTFPPTMVSGLMAEASAQSVSSHWAFHLNSPIDFWDRTGAASGESVDYCGTGGMVTDTRIFLESELFGCPRRFWFIEDLWLSYFAAHRLGWQLKKSSVAFEMSYDGQDQFVHLRERKSAFLRYLVKAGWKLPVDVERLDSEVGTF
jgi:hypothetical protein